MIRRPPRYTRTDTLLTDPTLFRSLVGFRNQPQFAKVDAVDGIKLAHFFKRAVDIDRRIPPRPAQFGNHPLRLAERIGADQHRTVRLGAHTADPRGYLTHSRRVEKPRPADGHPGDEDTATHRADNTRAERQHGG